MAKIILREQTTPETPSTWDAVVFVDTVDSKLKIVDDTGNEEVMASEDYVNETILDNSNNLKDKTYRPWEKIDKWNYVFVEEWVTQSSATQVQNIWDVTANTRVSTPIIGSGDASAILKLALSKTGSPSVDLWIRIETDNNGSPSGTLADANATATVTAASLTTSLADTTVTLAWSITLTEWTKYHIVTFQWTYWSETVNASNYYGIGYSATNTTTRYSKNWNWISRQTWDGAVTNDATETLSDWPSSTQSTDRGYKILTKNNLILKSVTKDTQCWATRALVKSNWWAILATASFSWNVATFTSMISLTDATNYRLELDDNGNNYAAKYDTSPVTPINRTNVTFVCGSEEWVDKASSYNIISISTAIAVWLPYMIYTSSDLFTDKLLSKTNTTYSYKIDRLWSANETVSIWTKPNIIMDWIDPNQTNMTYGELMFLSDTPWAIWNSGWMSTPIVGRVISATKLFLKNTFNR